MNTKTKALRILSSLNEIKWSVASKGILCGISAGLLTVLYRLMIEFGNEKALLIYSCLKTRPILLLPWFAVLAVAGLLIAWMVREEPMASGSGIPQVEGVVLYGLKMKWPRVLAVRFAGGVLGAFFGLSLGREGPSIQIGAAGSQAVAERMGKSKLEENYLITGGAAAGLSAAFNAPLSGMVFALEEVHRSFSPVILLAATTAALTADVLSKYFFGLKPVLSFSKIVQMPVGLYLWLIPLGIVSGLAGVLVNKSLLFFQTQYQRLPWFLRPLLALLLALPAGLFLPGILGGGQNLIKMAEGASGGLLLLLIFFAFKIIFTGTSFGSGVPGGIFMPILSVGALSGGIIGIAAVRFGVPPEYIPGFAVCAMAGALSASVKAPVTSILLAAEMTGSLVHLLPVAACSFIALLLSDILKVTPLYEALLERFVENNESAVPRSGKGGLIEVPVELGSSVAGKLVSEIPWPQGALVAAVKRGEKEFVPNGSTRLLPGDYLVILSSDDARSDTPVNIRELCRS
jgi:H+/Cl- antiporter ClcA